VVPALLLILGSRMRLIAVGLLVSEPGCESSFCVERNVSISEGVYGRVTYQTDVSPDSNPPEPVAGETILVADSPGGAVVTSGTSEDDGVYQLEVGPGSYSVCYANAALACEGFDVTTATPLIRVDLHKGQGTYWSREPRSDCSD